MIVPDEVVVEALMRDARRFKSKWELNVNEPERSKPNTRFLKRTLSNVVKMNKERMRRPRNARSFERELPPPSPKRDRSPSPLERPSRSKRRSSTSKRKESPKRHHKKSRNCSKSKHRSPSERRKSKGNHKSLKHKSKKSKSA